MSTELKEAMAADVNDPPCTPSSADTPETNNEAQEMSENNHYLWAHDNPMNHYDEQGKLQKFSVALSEFMGSTTIHGLPRVWENGPW